MMAKILETLSIAYHYFKDITSIFVTERNHDYDFENFLI